MTGEQDTGNPAWLPLAERARRGLLAGEPGLPLSELVELEYPTGAPEAFRRALRAAIAYGDLEAREREYIKLQPAISGRMEEPWTFRPRPVRTIEPFIKRETYRAWRAQCPASLLSPLSQVSKWLGAPALPQGEPEPLPQGEPDRPERVEKPRLSDKEILTLRNQGLSNDFIHSQYGVPRDRITRVNKKYEVPKLNPGPKPKGSY